MAINATPSVTSGRSRRPLRWIRTEPSPTRKVYRMDWRRIAKPRARVRGRRPCPAPCISAVSPSRPASSPSAMLGPSRPQYKCPVASRNLAPGRRPRRLFAQKPRGSRGAGLAAQDGRPTAPIGGSGRRRVPAATVPATAHCNAGIPVRSRTLGGRSSRTPCATPTHPPPPQGLGKGARPPQRLRPYGEPSSIHGHGRNGCGSGKKAARCNKSRCRSPPPRGERRAAGRAQPARRPRQPSLPHAA